MLWVVPCAVPLLLLRVIGRSPLIAFLIVVAVLLVSNTFGGWLLRRFEPENGDYKGSPILLTAIPVAIFIACMVAKRISLVN